MVGVREPLIYLGGPQSFELSIWRDLLSVLLQPGILLKPADIYTFQILCLSIDIRFIFVKHDLGLH